MSDAESSPEAVAPPEEPKKEKKLFRCTMCRVTCQNDVSFQAHNRGTKHLKVLRQSGGYHDFLSPPPKKYSSLRDFISDPDRVEPLIGLKYVEEGRKVSDSRHYRCTLCNLDMTMKVVFDHLIGHKHRRSYLNKHFPLLIKGVPAMTINVTRSLAKEVEDEEGVQTYATNVQINLQPQPSKKGPKGPTKSKSGTMEKDAAEDGQPADGTSKASKRPRDFSENEYPTKRGDYAAPQYDESNEDQPQYQKRGRGSRSQSRGRGSRSRNRGGDSQYRGRGGGSQRFGRGGGGPQRFARGGGPQRFARGGAPPYRARGGAPRYQSEGDYSDYQSEGDYSDYQGEGDYRGDYRDEGGYRGGYRDEGGYRGEGDYPAYHPRDDYQNQDDYPEYQNYESAPQYRRRRSAHTMY